jgi:hypothetical protein
MRTTLTIDDDILAIARAHAEREERSIGAVISELARRGVLAANPTAPSDAEEDFPTVRRAPNARLVTLEDVNRLRDDWP